MKWRAKTFKSPPPPWAPTLPRWLQRLQRKAATEAGRDERGRAIETADKSQNAEGAS